MTSLSSDSLPCLTQPAYPGESLREAGFRLARQIEQRLQQQGGVLLRGFGCTQVEEFRQFAASFGHPLLNYDFASTPRSQLNRGVYTSTEYPAHSAIPLHGEQSYTREWPLKIWFFSVQAAQSGGETPIADARRVLAELPARLVEQFCREGLLYVRHYGDELDLPWQQVFNTDNPAQVDAYCRRHAIDCDWLDDGILRTRQRCQAVARHPRTSEQVWFNQAHLFHSSALAPEVRAVLIDLYGDDRLPRQVYYGNGQPIADADLDRVRQVLERCQILFP